MPNPRGEISLADGRQVHGLDLGVQDIWEGHEAYKDLEEPIRADGCVRRAGYRWGAQLHCLQDQAVGHHSQAIYSVELHYSCFR